MEGARKLKEIYHTHAEACPVGELKHGPLALVGDEMPLVAVAVAIVVVSPGYAKRHGCGEAAQPRQIRYCGATSNTKLEETMRMTSSDDRRRIPLREPKVGQGKHILSANDYGAARYCANFRLCPDRLSRAMKRSMS